MMIDKGSVSSQQGALVSWGSCKRATFFFSRTTYKEAMQRQIGRVLDGQGL